MNGSSIKRSTDAGESDSTSKKKAKRAVDGSTKHGSGAANEDASQAKKKEKPPDRELELQQSLLRSDPTLAKRFLEAMKSKPEDMSKKSVARSFWAARQHLLRAHAIEREQRRANYNVLSEVKPRTVEGAIQLNITPEQVEDIFRQHPVVRKAYDETVPSKFRDNMTFWAAFFNSRLFKRLKGIRIVEKEDPRDPILDRYLDNDQEQIRIETGQQVAQQHVSHFIDLVGNEENHSQRRGNAPDMTMRPGTEPGSRPIMQALNSLSEKIMTVSTPADEGDSNATSMNEAHQQPHAPIGMSEETYNELRLRDLAVERRDDRIRLHVRERQLLHDDHTQAESTKSSKKASAGPVPEDPREILKMLRADLRPLKRSGPAKSGRILAFDLSKAIGMSPSTSDLAADDSESDSEMAGTETRSSHRTAERRAERAIQDAITARATAGDDTFFTSTSAVGNDTANKTLAALPSSIGQDLMLTHGTTCEFLHYFWTLLLQSFPALTVATASASEPAPAPEAPLPRDLTPLLTTLTNSIARIDAVAAAAEEARQTNIKEQRKRLKEASRRLGQSSIAEIDEHEAGGGKKEVQALMTPAVKAVKGARQVFSWVARADQ